jgi:putative peptidoglycan lipid II flippase
MGAGLWSGVLVWGPLLGLPGWKFVGLGILVGGGILVYALLGQWFGAFRLAEFRRAFRRG